MNQNEPCLRNAVSPPEKSRQCPHEEGYSKTIFKSDRGRVFAGGNNFDWLSWLGE